ncbi:DUF6527 family protein [Pseudoalteromonas lipolytica]|uniref:DUF6527 family protein n=2 Tax=Pseudoalteromonas TaxID=53246 RepID=UPI0012DF71C3|nr:DUF6527 family protein [Pseudoalteromonas lipolytica]|tara:strand:+ start:4434 stop:4805 length:372 start_codon:yes stop_codon:yes gene_type:complete
MKMQHKFVDYVPENIQSTTLYISLEYGTAVHKCCCGCGEEVVTPLSPSDWKLIFDGNSISLKPSIGNWSFKCRSHYFITKSRVVWCNDTGLQMIENTCNSTINENSKLSLFDKLKNWWSNLKR